MTSETPSLPQPEPGRLARPLTSDTSGWKRWLPGLQTLRRYDLTWLPSDVVAGLVLTTMLVPVGIAYAVASGVPGIYGLYATIIPLLAYALFGPSRILVLGPDSSLAALILAVVLPRAAGDPARAVALAGMLAVVSGLVCIVAGLLRLGSSQSCSQADPLRLHERHCAHSADQPAAQAVRVSIETGGPLRASGGSPARWWAAVPAGPRLSSARARSR
jgi:hypothetical protein